MRTFFLLGFATVAVLLPRLARAGFVVVAFDFAGFANDLALTGFVPVVFDFADFANDLILPFRTGAVCFSLDAFFAASFSCFTALLLARIASFAAYFAAFLACFSAF